MFNIQRYWQDIRALEATIGDEEPFLVSLDDRSLGMVGGLVVQIKRESAAKLILAKSHRLATPEEIEQYNLASQAREVELRDELMRKAGHSTYTLSPVRKSKS